MFKISKTLKLAVAVCALAVLSTAYADITLGNIAFDPNTGLTPDGQCIVCDYCWCPDP